MGESERPEAFKVFLKAMSFGLCFALTFLFTPLSYSAPNSITINGRILKADNSPLTFNSVRFQFTVVNPAGTCVLYSEEITNVDMSGSNGYFTVALGSGTAKFPTSGALSVSEYFSNGSVRSCQGGGSYTPAASDGRLVRTQFYDGSAWHTFSPDSVVRSVPYAWSAANSNRLEGFSANDFLRLTGVPTCTADTYLTYDGMTLSCASSLSSGVLPVNKGGTGATTLTQYGVLLGNGTSAVSAVASAVAGRVLTSNGVGTAPSWQVIPSAFTGTTNYVPYFNTTTSLGNSPIIISGTNVGVGMTPSVGTRLHVDGNITSVGSITASANMNATAFLYTSDRRLKKDVKPIEDSVEVINKLRGVRFTWRSDNAPDVGFIAQEVEKVVPALVSTGVGAAGEKTKSVKYGNIVAITVEAIKELWDKISGLDERLQILEQRNLQLVDENAKLRADLDQNLKLMNERLGRLEEK